MPSSLLKKNRFKPNVLITGTPGTGKSRLSEAVAERCGMRWIDVSKEAIARNCCDGRDDELDSAILDEDKLLDTLEDEMQPGGNVVDYHSCEFFPERWFDVVYVLRTDTAVLYDRLAARGYSKNKVDNNISCEIFQTILEEAKESYEESIVHEILSNNEEDLALNVENIYSWVRNYTPIKK